MILLILHENALQLIANLGAGWSWPGTSVRAAPVFIRGWHTQSVGAQAGQTPVSTVVLFM